MTKPLVSIIVNCYNGEKYLQDAINSIYAQSYQNWEIIFWDNNSNDNSAEIALSCDKKLRYYKSQSTTTLGKARAQAVSKAKGEYLAFLDCDDLWHTKKIEKQILFQKMERLSVSIQNKNLLYKEIFLKSLQNIISYLLFRC